MASLNLCQFIGRLGRDPEVRTLQTGNSVAIFSIACSESWKDKHTGEKKEKTEWINCVVWGALSDVVAKYVHKGDLIYVSGKFTTRKWEKDGITHYTTEIVVNNMTMLGSKKQDGQAGSTPAPSSGGSVADDFISGGVPSSSTDTSTDDLPF